MRPRVMAEEEPLDCLECPDAVPCFVGENEGQFHQFRGLQLQAAEV